MTPEINTIFEHRPSISIISSFQTPQDWSRQSFAPLIVTVSLVKVMQHIRKLLSTLQNQNCENATHEPSSFSPIDERGQLGPLLLGALVIPPQEFRDFLIIMEYPVGVDVSPRRYVQPQLSHEEHLVRQRRQVACSCKASRSTNTLPTLMI